MIKEYAGWCKSKGIQVGLELNPHVSTPTVLLEQVMPILMRIWIS
jgi:hypothetical protein